MNTRIASFLSALLIVGASGCASTSHKAPEAAESYAPVATYPIGGAGGWDFLSVDGPGHRRYVSRGENSIAVIDMASLAVSNEWPLGSCEGPTGLAIDRRHDRLFSVCHNRKMIVVDARTGSVAQELPIGIARARSRWIRRRIASICRRLPSARRRPQRPRSRILVR